MRIATTGDIGHWLAMTGFWARSTAQVRRADRDIRPYEVRGKEYDRVGGREGCPYGGQRESLFCWREKTLKTEHLFSISYLLILLLWYNSKIPCYTGEHRNIMPKFKVVSEYTPSGDQPQAIEKLAAGLEAGLRQQVLLGVTGSGKTYTMAKVIEKVQRPTLVLAHNKTLAAQLCEEFREFFPENAVEYFVSYYDYYQPEAYIAHTDTFIEKDASINAEIERLRHSATAALFERRDVIVVASVSCIYGLGDPIDYANMVISLRRGKEYPRDQLLRKLVEIRYERNDVAFERNMFRVRGDTVEIYPVYANGYAIRVEFFGDEVDRISEFNPVTGQAQRIIDHVAIYPASHYVTTKEKMARATEEIERELAELFFSTKLPIYLCSPRPSCSARFRAAVSRESEIPSPSRWISGLYVLPMRIFRR